MTQPGPGGQVTVLRRSGKIGTGIGVTSRWVVLGALRDAGVQMLTGVSYTRIRPGFLEVVAADGAAREVPADTVVVCAGQEPVAGLAGELERVGVACAVVGERGTPAPSTPSARPAKGSRRPARSCPPDAPLIRPPLRRTSDVPHRGQRVDGSRFALATSAPRPGFPQAADAGPRPRYGDRTTRRWSVRRPQGARRRGRVNGGDILEREVRELVRRRGIDPTRDAAAARQLVADALSDYDERTAQGVVPALDDPQAVARRVLDAVAGFGPLQPYLDDPEVEEVWVNGPAQVFVARRGEPELTTTILSPEQLRDLVERMLASSGRRLDLSSPFVDAALPGGERLHVVIPDGNRRRREC
ncbi:hypothetical protein GCM10025864_00620 [Luteimicrobium album]|uniref:Bacterial type II secretion system protein E domain-containing protein n=1 Tax=Luteimicrobium album TaxID=1054550 RepID=A0ABQ6HUU7_9MICO|nr:hypothetical protein GCM10025864_00620 [Luteimicrobium album]